MYTIYTIANCEYCDKAKDLLRFHNQTFQEIAVDLKPEVGRAVVERTGLKTWPQIFQGDGFVGGYMDLVKWI